MFVNRSSVKRMAPNWEPFDFLSLPLIHKGSPTLVNSFMKTNIEAIKYIVQAVLDKSDLKPLDISELITEQHPHLELHYATLLLRDAGYIIVHENRIHANLEPDKLYRLSIERLTWAGHQTFEHSVFQNNQWVELHEPKI